MVTKDKRRRVQFRFWLDANDPDQSALGERLDDLKTARQFAPTLRSALRLYFALLDGNLAVLCEMFPEAAAQLQGNRPAPPSPERAPTPEPSPVAVIDPEPEPEMVPEPVEDFDMFAELEL